MHPPLLIVDNNIEFSKLEQVAWLRQDIVAVRCDNMQKAIELQYHMRFHITTINADSVNYLPSLRVMREASPTLIIIRTSNFKIEDQIEANNNGAHYYCAFGKCPDEDVKVVMAIYNGLVGYSETRDISADMLSINDMIINLVNKEVSLNNIPIRLTRIEFRLLYYLVSNNNRVLTYKMLYREIWGDDSFSNALIHQHIYSLRSKLSKARGNYGYIENVSGYGYRFSAKSKER